VGEADEKAIGFFAVPLRGNNPVKYLGLDGNTIIKNDTSRYIIFLIFIVISLSLLNSCLEKTTKILREEIKQLDSGIVAVGIIENWTYSDYKYIAFDINLTSNRRLFISSVNYRKLPGREPFYLTGVGNYSLAEVVRFIDKRGKENRTVIRPNKSYGASTFSRLSEIKIKSIQEAVKYYDDIYAYIDSLPMVDESNFQEILQKGNWTPNKIEETEYSIINIYLVRMVWQDKYYGYEWKDGEKIIRKPDYNSDKPVIALYFWGI
jgi:hypothetical protein